MKHKIRKRTWLRYLEGAEYGEMAKRRGMSASQVIAVSMARRSQCLDMGIRHSRIVDYGLDNPFADHSAWKTLLNEQQRYTQAQLIGHAKSSKLEGMKVRV